MGEARRRKQAEPHYGQPFNIELVPDDKWGNMANHVYEIVTGLSIETMVSKHDGNTSFMDVIGSIEVYLGSIYNHPDHPHYHSHPDRVMWLAFERMIADDNRQTEMGQ